MFLFVLCVYLILMRIMIPLCFFQGLVYIPFTSFKIAIKFVHSESAFSYLPFCCCCCFQDIHPGDIKLKCALLFSSLFIFSSGCHHLKTISLLNLKDEVKQMPAFLSHAHIPSQKRIPNPKHRYPVKQSLTHSLIAPIFLS